MKIKICMYRIVLGQQKISASLGKGFVFEVVSQKE
jgi:hypothetical protein